MAYLYPWGNTQQLNLDWILQKLKSLEAGTSGAVDLTDVANALISASYAQQAYDRSDIVFRDGKLYRANQAIPAPGEAWTPAHWDEILLGDTVSNLVQYVAALSNNQIANSSSVSGTYTSDALDALKNAIDGITLDSDNVSNESQVTGDSVSDALDNLSGAIGDEATARGNADSLIESTLAIMANGNVHDAIEQGRYMYIKGHNTLPEGLYKTVAAIPVDGVLNSTNVTQIVTGGFNQLLEESFSVTSPYITWSESSFCNCKKIGNIILISGGIMPTADAPGSGWTNVALIPTGYRPAGNVLAIGFGYDGSGITNTYAVRVQSWGGIQVMQLQNNVETCFFDFFYFL